MIDTDNLRQRVEEDIRSGLWAIAHQHLAQLWQLDPTMVTASYILNCQSRLQDNLPLIPYRLAFLRSFSVEPLVTLLRAGAFASGVNLAVDIGDFNAYAQEILNPDSNLYKADLDVVILAVQTRDIALALWERFSALSPEQTRAEIERVIQRFCDYVHVFRAYSDAYLILHNLEEPITPSLGVLDGLADTGQVGAIQSINQELRRIQHDYPGVFVLDYNALIAQHGRKNWFDERNWASVRLPIANNNLIHLVKEWLRFIHPLSGRICKVLVTDLDNTLWGGVLGEDGIEGIKCGPDYPDSCHWHLQQAMLDIHQRGILLAICSKNDKEDAIEALEKHPGLLLRPRHFTAMRINWQDKVQNLREIAAELNVGIDSIAYLDDNPVELEKVRTGLPWVCVIELPDDPKRYADALRENPVFERLALSTEDKERHRYYAEQRERIEVRRKAASLEDFYRSLKQEIKIAEVTPELADRIAQLTNKTNQFNLTTRRYSKQQIMSLASRPGWKIFGVWVKDRFGDSGLSGVAIMHDSDEICEIDTFLLSCRVIGRSVETALLSFLVKRAQSLGLKQLQGMFLPTKKNAVARDFYRAHNFQLLAEQGGGSLWGIALKATDIVCPEWIQLTVAKGAPN